MHGLCYNRCITLYLFLAVVALNIPFYWMLGNTFFGGWNGWWRVLDLASWRETWANIEQDRTDHNFAKLHLLLIVIACISTTLAEYFVIAKFIFGFADPWAFLRS